MGNLQRMMPNKADESCVLAPMSGNKTHLMMIIPTNLLKTVVPGPIIKNKNK